MDESGGLPEDRLAVALDFPSAALALDCVDRLDGSVRWLKVGLELFCAAGQPLVETLRKRGFAVFVDLKLHDIPNTVAGAVRTLATTGAGLLTVHASGGAAMLEAAAKASAGLRDGPRLLAVTVLTSMDAGQLSGVGIADSPGAQVLRLGRLAAACGIDGLVCSAEEIGALREGLPAGTMLVVPGIRQAGEAPGDQRRVATARVAIERGASMLVVGRPITQAPDPGAAARAVLAEIAAGL